MNILTSNRGDHFSVKTSIQSSVRLGGFEKFMDGDNTLVTGFTITANERVSIIPCFKEYTHVFAFGHAPENSVYSVDLLVLLGASCNEKSSGQTDLESIVSLYSEFRVSAFGSCIALTIGSAAFTGALSNITLRGVDPERRIVQVTLSLTGIEPPK